jgi:hypothetical protein
VVRRIRRAAGGLFDLIIANGAGVEIARLSGPNDWIELASTRPNSGSHALQMRNNLTYSGKVLTSTGAAFTTGGNNAFAVGDLFAVRRSVTPITTAGSPRLTRQITGVTATAITAAAIAGSAAANPDYSTTTEESGLWIDVSTVPTWRVVRRNSVLTIRTPNVDLGSTTANSAISRIWGPSASAGPPAVDFVVAGMSAIAAGDRADVHVTALPRGWQCSAAVADDQTVTVTWINRSGITGDPGNATVYIQIVRP